MIKFKPPGSHQPLVSGDGNKVIVIDAATRAELVRQRQEALRAMQPKELRAPNGAFSDSGNSPAAPRRQVVCQMADPSSAPQCVTGKPWCERRVGLSQ
jgi:predicted AlkP superfamily pyrophosphatase or phosphodiesterase